MKRRLTEAERDAFRAAYGCDPPEAVTVIPAGQRTIPLDEEYVGGWPATRERVAKTREMLADGRDYGEIAKALKVSRSTVRTYVFRMGGLKNVRKAS